MARCAILINKIKDHYFQIIQDNSTHKGNFSPVSQGPSVEWKTLKGRTEKKTNEPNHPAQYRQQYTCQGDVEMFHTPATVCNVYFLKTV